MFYKVVGRKGAKREILAPLLPGEYVDREGLVVKEGRRIGRGAREVPATGSNTTPVTSARMPFGQNQNYIPERIIVRQVDNPVQDMTEQLESDLLVQRSSPGGHLGSQVSTNGRRPSLSQEQRTPASKRKSRGSKGSTGSPGNTVKKVREVDWVWDKPNNSKS